jgi:hypothetical protein
MTQSVVLKIPTLYITPLRFPSVSQFYTPTSPTFIHLYNICDLNRFIRKPLTCIVAILATFQEHNINYEFPSPISRVVFAYATLTDPLHVIQVVQFHSVTVYNIEDEVVAYLQRLTAQSL